MHLGKRAFSLQKKAEKSFEKNSKKCLTYQKENVKVLSVLLKRSANDTNQSFEKKLKKLKKHIDL